MIIKIRNIDFEYNYVIEEKRVNQKSPCRYIT